MRSPLPPASLARMGDMGGTAGMVTGTVRIPRGTWWDHVDRHGFLFHTRMSAYRVILQGHPQDHAFGIEPMSCITSNA